MKIIKTITGVSLIFIGTLSICFAIIMQSVICYQRLGVLITKNLIVPHWSAWFYLGGVLIVLGYFIAVSLKNKR